MLQAAARAACPSRSPMARERRWWLPRAGTLYGSDGVPRAPQGQRLENKAGCGLHGPRGPVWQRSRAVCPSRRLENKSQCSCGDGSLVPAGFHVISACMTSARDIVHKSGRRRWLPTTTQRLQTCLQSRALTGQWSCQLQSHNTKLVSPSQAWPPTEINVSPPAPSPQHSQTSKFEFKLLDVGAPAHPPLLGAAPLAWLPSICSILGLWATSSGVWSYNTAYLGPVSNAALARLGSVSSANAADFGPAGRHTSTPCSPCWAEQRGLPQDRFVTRGWPALESEAMSTPCSPC